MGVVKRFTDQIVVMNTPEQGAQIRALADEFDESVSEVARVAQSYGLPKVAEHFRKLKGTRRVSSTPKAEFVSPA